MPDLQLYLTIGFPTIAVLASLTINLVQISAIREDARETRAEVCTQVGLLREEIREIRSDIRQIRADIKLLTGNVYEFMGNER